MQRGRGVTERRGTVPQGPRHIEDTTVILIHCGGGKKKTTVVKHYGLSGMFRRSASLAILHRKSFAAIPSISVVLLRDTNRNVKLSHDSQREVAPSFGHFQDRLLATKKEKWGKKTGLCFARFVFLTFRGPLASHDSLDGGNSALVIGF